MLIDNRSLCPPQDECPYDPHELEILKGMALLNARPLIQYLISDPDQKLKITDGDRFNIALTGLNVLASRLYLHLPVWSYFL